ncbi:1-aminocyclopropane-1-carboxylate deaminase/D-cysteine desulfhydrase [Nonlabens sp. YIK11]|uniref:1-aminocyclopropane-1-carboxylate deaminase/D-cysteine desulfhydrase n=1 Tax=Nonlabens sp. YIK11 TaxID=1453349 RepID=UPI001E453F7E|nr:pyridoxal-phosphate dependent enzyme [Nonlabens sp. YIK11]
MILPFYLWYLVEYLIGRLTMNHDQAYRNIIFEREAYAMENDLNYLSKRSRWSFLDFYGKSNQQELFKCARSKIQSFASFPEQQITIDIKREDLLHPTVSGNKLRKLKYNLQDAIDHGFDQIITYGGAYSNHIAATAAACHILGIKSIGVIRGEELGIDLEKTLSQNETLKTAASNGMKLVFVTREEYKKKDSVLFEEKLRAMYGTSYFIPEGGTNDLAVKGTAEILTSREKQHYQFVCVAAGTGGTAAGIINSTADHQHVLVFSALQGDFLKKEIEKYTDNKNFTLIPEDAFGGYAKSTDSLIDYLNVRFRESEIPLDPIYTGKMMYRIEQMVASGFFSDKTRILAIHTGGLQGIPGFNRRLRKKGRLQLQYEDYI